MVLGPDPAELEIYRHMETLYSADSIRCARSDTNEFHHRIAEESLSRDRRSKACIHNVKLLSVSQHTF